MSAETVPLTELSVVDSMDVDLCRRQAAFLAGRAGLTPANQTRFATATADVAWNAVKHAGGGMVSFSVVLAPARQQLQALVCDNGPGIPNLKELLQNPPNGKRGGLAGVRRLVDAFHVDTGPERGTVVLVRKNMPLKMSEVNAETASEWVAAMSVLAEIPAPSIIRQQNEELLSALDQVHQKERDMRRQLRRIKRLNERLDLLSLVASQTDNGVVICDAEGRVEWLNDGFTRISGYRLPEVRGRKPGEFLQGPLTDPQVVEQMRQAIRRRESIAVEVLNYHRAGHTYWQLVTITPILNRQGELQRFIAIQSDVTEHKLAEQALREKKEEAEQANRSRNEFLANISHEIRTPMNAIIGMTELTLSSELSHQQRRNLELVKESADSLLRLLNDVLNFSRLESGRFDIDRSPFGLRDLVDQTVRALAVQAHSKGLELVYRVPPGVPDRLIGDAARLRQVMVNLIGNAIKFTDSGEVELAVALDSRVGREVVLHFGVRDTGPGIRQEVQQKIFRPFTQGDGAMTRRSGGAGLGLAISRQLINLMGGRIWVRSQPGQGSTFHFTIRSGLAEPEETVEPLPLELSDLKNLPVLVVDDNATNRRILVEALENWHMQPAAAADADEAIKMMEEAAQRGEPFGLVLLDAVMPGTDGFALAEKIHERPELAQSTIMMLSSSDQRSHQGGQVTQLDLAGFLTKPVTQSDLLDAILRAVGKTIGTDHRESENARKIVPIRARRRILVAEDTVANQYLVKQILERRGHDVVVANNGQEAVERWGELVFDAVLMDVQMPMVDGFEATRRIRQLERQSERHTPIVAMTAHAMRGDRERCLSAGMDAYLSKPIDSQEVIALVESFARRTPLPQPTQSQDESGVVYADDVPATTETPHGAAAQAEKLVATTIAASQHASAGAKPTPWKTSPEPTSTESANETDSQAASNSVQADDDYFTVAVTDDDEANGSVILSTAPLPDAPSAFLFDAALSRLDGNVPLFKSLIELFRQDVPELLTQLRLSIAVQDADTLRRAAHKLKGAVSIYDAHKSVELAKRLEKLARGNQFDEAEAISAALHADIQLLLEALDDFYQAH
jgi:PAS domain S-box-containing protein